MKTLPTKTSSWLAPLRTLQTSAPGARVVPTHSEFDVRQVIKDFKAPGDSLPPKTRGALRAAAGTLSEDPTGKTFLKHLGIIGAPYVRRPETQEAQAKMDHHLLEAWRTFKDATREWRLGEDLGAEVGAFIRAQWPGWKDLDEPPPKATPLRAALFRAAKAVDGVLPKSGQGVRNSVQRALTAEMAVKTEVSSES
jgi:hypothetical protein